MINANRNLKKIIGIIGGMGPSAGITLHQKIISNTNSLIDQNHIPIIHTSFSNIIPDRTDYILNKTNDNPYKGGLISLKMLNDLIEYNNVDEVLIGIPCNTFHSPKIFYPFSFIANDIYHDRFKIFNMVDLTVNYIKKNCNGKIGLLSTLGTIESKLYYNKFKENDLELIYLDDIDNFSINDAIYNKDWGIKSINNPTTNKSNDIILNSINKYKKNDINNIILGCTEIPLVTNNLKIKNVNLIDPIEILANELISNYFD